MTEKFVYKVSSQGKAWGSDLYFERDYSTYLFLKWILGEHFHEEKKRKTDPHLIYQLGNLTLGALSYLHVGTSSRRSRLKPGMVLGHGWVERGSSQVIQSSSIEFRPAYELLMLLNWVCKFQPLKELQFWVMRFLFHFLD